MKILGYENQHLWTPGGVVDLQIEKAQKAVRDYDERLELMKHEETGDWVVFVRLERDLYYPIIGWRELPEPEAIQKQLYEIDGQRRGTEILDTMNRRNAEIRKKREDAASEADGIAAEAFEWGYRFMGKHPNPRIFVPGR